MSEYCQALHTLIQTPCTVVGPLLTALGHEESHNSLPSHGCPDWLSKRRGGIRGASGAAILACVVVAAAVVLIPTAVGSACASGRCREGTIASAGATDDDEDDGGFSTAPQYETKTAGDSSTTTVHSSLRDEAPSSSSSAPTQSPTSPDFTSPPTLPPTTFETSMNDMMEMQALTTKLQPRVTVVEGRPAHRGIASISNPGASPRRVSYCCCRA
jgi:hypothetical protein